VAATCSRERAGSFLGAISRLSGFKTDNAGQTIVLVKTWTALLNLSRQRRIEAAAGKHYEQ
jgi:hypothetical protein